MNVDGEFSIPMNFTRLSIHHWPFITFVWILATILTSYFTSVLRGDVYPIFPYISDTAAVPPASCTFGFMINIAAILMAVTLYLRYCQVNVAISTGNTCLNNRWNNVAFWCGNIVCIGVSIVASYQETQLLMHAIGALMVLVGGWFYLIIQTKISMGLKDINSIMLGPNLAKNIIRRRLVLTCLYLPVFLTTIVGAVISLLTFKGNNWLLWTKECGGYEIHLVSTFSEWLLIIIIGVYLLTFTKEFKLIQFEGIDWTSKYLDSHTHT